MGSAEPNEGTAPMAILCQGFVVPVTEMAPGGGLLEQRME